MSDSAGPDGAAVGTPADAPDASRFRAVLDASPDAVVVVDASGIILQVNPQATVLFGYEQDELLGRSVDDLLPESLRGGHAHHRERFHAAPKPRTMAAGRDLFARHQDGTEVPVDVSLGLLEFDGRPAVAAFVRDATERRHLTEVTLALQDAAVRRKQALEINDNVVQGLASVIYTLEAGETTIALGAARRTLAAARSMMNDLMAGAGTELGRAQLVRDSAPVSVLGHRAASTGGTTVRAVDAARVLVVDDADDLRLLLRATLSIRETYEVVGEAADGMEAIELAEQLRPDLVLLDLAMPRMDGFDALPRLRALLPDAAIVVLSGFVADRMEERALELGADRYVEKGTSSAALLELLDGLMGRSPVAAPTLPRDPELGHDPTELGLQKLSHELRTPLTVIRSMIDTLHDQMDALPTAAVREILTAAARNADAMRDLLDSVVALHRLGTGGLYVAVEPRDLSALVREIVGDLRSLTARHDVVLTLEPGVRADVDPLRIRQIVSNLLSNAVKFAPPGTPIEVTVAAVDGDATIAVADGGPGVPPHREGQLFQRFERLGVAGPGMGLGLYISRAMARAHGGDLRHERPAEGGARFVFVTPARATTDPGGRTVTPGT